ncbi:tetratricopeptide repeat-containing sensor histidine kinase [Psychroserpens sp. S379A]|uniref:tetratricopeptide repeat-containing sensor histidine kinase n=1 Tax=Psychroserpens sp. S379A TaxID=3415137 RepID=UPI003C79D7E5
MKNIFTLIVFIGNFCLAQNSSYIDSLKTSISKYSDAQQLQIINDVPYDKYVGDIKTSEKMFHYASDIAIKLNDSLALGDMCFKLSEIYSYKEKPKKRTAYALKAIKIYERLNNNVKAGVAYGQLGYNLKYSDVNTALDYMRKGIKLLESEENLTSIDPLYDNYGIIQALQKQYDSALFYNNKSLKIKKHLNDSLGLGFGYATIANVYSEVGKFDLAKAYIDSSFVIRRALHDNYGIAANYTHTADIYFNAKQYKTAIVNYDKSLKMAQENNYVALERYCYQMLSNAYVELEDYKRAYDFNTQFQTLKDSVINIETNEKVQQLKIEFETEKKEKEILSQRADLAEQELELNEKNTQLLGLGLLAVVLSLLGYLFYNQQRLKNRQLKKENELKDALLRIETQNRLQEQRLRISRDLHDNIGAQLTFIISSLDNLKYGFKLPEKLSEKLKNISEFTTTTIYELRDTIWAMNKNEITIEDLQLRISNFIEKANIAASQIKFQFNSNISNVEHFKLTSLQGMNVYRIIQEAINNAIKYSKAKHITIDFNYSDEQLKIQVIDDGKGFDIKTTQMNNGIYNMKKRAQEINGELVLLSQIDKGTTVVINI